MTFALPDTQSIDPGFLTRVEAPGQRPASSQAEMDAALTVLQSYKKPWVRLDLAERFIILEQVLEDLCAVSEEWFQAGLQAKEISGNLVAEAEEWAMLGCVMRQVSLLIQSLRDIQEHGRPQIPGPIGTRAGGQVTAQVFPICRFDRLYIQGTTAEVWMQPGITEEEMITSQARFYHDDQPQGRVCLVLGAGNTTNTPSIDVLNRLFVQGQVVLLKTNPVNDYLGPILSKAFRELISRGFLRIVYGGAREGGYLCDHPYVDEIHMTGSDKTYETILFGPGEEGARRKAERRPLLKKPFSGELGCVTPLIIVPGAWDESDIEKQAERVAIWLTINAGFQCLTPRVLITWAGWDQRGQFMEALATALDQADPRKAYYPGAKQRLEQFLTAYPDALQIGGMDGEYLPWVLINGLDPADEDNICFKNESFCSMIAETAVPAPDLFSYLEKAVRFANETLWGNLSATLIVHPKCMKKRHIKSAVECAVADLRVGMVLVNQFAGFAYMIGSCTWGAFPGNDIGDIQSGTGVACNALMFEHPQKTVVRGPFSLPLDPLSLHSRTVHDTCRKMNDVHYRPSLRNISDVLWSAVRS